ncbi:MAG: LysR family transcriptional regulator [Rhodobacterales bacterium]|nr:LysR family transcriptional regulator [Rhodobacterales bacterium]
MNTMRWSDLEYVLAVAGRGSVAAAARALGVNHTTVLRRVQTFETRLGQTLFERRRTGYRVTTAGQAFVEAALAIEATVAALDRKVAGGDSALEGALSVTTTDSIAPALAPDLARFNERYPRVRLSLSVTNARLDLDTRDADIAVRASSNPPAHLVGRRVCDLRFGAYATAPRQAADAGLPLAQRPWLGLEAPLSASVCGVWMDDAVPARRHVLRANSFISLADLARQGLGTALLPRHLGDGTPGLERLPEGPRDLATGLWVLCHRDVLRSARVRAGADFLYAALKARSGAFDGTAIGGTVQSDGGS